MKNNNISEKEERLKKLNELTKRKINPFPSKTKRTHRIVELISDFDKIEKNKKNVFLAGRVMSKRSHGNLTFAHIYDGSERIQIALSKKDIGVDLYKDFVRLVDVGDFIQIEGTCFVTHKGEKSVMATNWLILTKSINSLPDKWHGIKDDEDRYRKRYLDILFNDDLREMFIKKAKFWDVTRKFMKDNGFFEVETPTLEITTGGAEANPFKTHHKDFDIDLYLRISIGELWQKRLMAAGYEKTFEIGRAYRNEGSSPNHLQEFTNMEFYWAYANYRDGMELTKKLYFTIAKEVFGTTKFKTREHTYDLSDEWKEIDYREEVLRQTGVDVIKTSEDEIKAKLKSLKVKYEGDNRERLTDTLWKYCRKNISGPAFLINHPKLISPLAKEKDNQSGVTERFQIILAGAEIGNGYSELNNPIDQRNRFEEQQKLIDAGDEEAMMPDMEFVEMLEYGMPPTCGFGFGERLFSFLVDKPIRETTYFPLMKPKYKLNEESSKLKNKKSDVKSNTLKDTSLGMNYNEAKKILDKYIKNDITKLHCIESEAIMRAVAKRLGEDEEKWGIIGLLHDIDWDETKDDVKNHTVKAVEILAKEGGSDFLIESVASHCYGNKECGNYMDKERTTNLEYCLVASETLTGLIIAAALMQPDKKLASVKLSSLKKKFKNKSFARNCNRDLIKECEKAGIELGEFLEIGLKALQSISNELKL